MTSTETKTWREMVEELLELFLLLGFISSHWHFCCMRMKCMCAHSDTTGGFLDRVPPQTISGNCVVFYVLKNVSLVSFLKGLRVCLIHLLNTVKSSWLFVVLFLYTSLKTF